MADLIALKRKRGTIKGSLTSFQKFFDTVKIKEKLSDLEVGILKERLDSTAGLLAEFHNIHSEILSICDDDAVDEHQTELENFEEKFFSQTVTAKLFLKKYDDPNDSVYSYRPESSAVKLPDISLPKFNGNFEDWLEFRDTFETLIHNNQRLSAIEKFFYLRGALEGTAAASIKKIQYTADNYTVAWDTLCERFNNTKKLLHDHLCALFFFEPIQKGSCEKLQFLADNISKHLGAIEQLGQSVDNWDCLLIFWISQKIDNASLCDWQRQKRNQEESPTIDEFLQFLRERANFVDSLEYKCNQMQVEKGNVKMNKDSFRNVKKVTSRAFVAGHYKCYYCKGEHSIYSCQDFLNISPFDRNKFVKNNPILCRNCLREGHSFYKCKIGPCKKCKGRHNTLLHQEIQVSQTNDNNFSNAENTENIAAGLSSGVVGSPVGHVILSTARVLVYDSHNNLQSLRALLDCGSQTSFITERARKRLNLSIQPTNLSIFGISNNISSVKSKCNVLIKSHQNSFMAKLTCFILPEIIGNLPSSSLATINLNIPANLELADPEFSEPAPIDMLIGADLFWQLLGSHKISLGKNLPFLQETKLGWIVSGQIGISIPTKVSCSVSLNQELLQLLTRFWEVEELTNVRILSEDELLAERIFSETTRRDNDGRFIVDMPLKQNPEILGESRSQAEHRFCALERRLIKNPNLQAMYQHFMAEYIELNHMSSIDNASKQQYEYYMPHHGVLKEASLTTKLRVVFDASAPTSNGISLNNIQLIGPILQSDLLSIILRFRQYTYVISADIAKMYRQVLVSDTHKSLQRILWRKHPSEPLKTYQLNTVTYGQASASFLSIRCLFQLASDIEDNKPHIARIIREDFYVDDLLTGADSIGEARQISHDVSECLRGGCFELRKWCSNDTRVLENVNYTDLAYDILDFSKDDKTKTLGLIWACQGDSLLYNINLDTANPRITKRTILSSISKIFDPLGLLGPCTILAKILIQQLWSEKTSWDEEAPEHLKTKWITFYNELYLLNNLSIPRHAIIRDAILVELHGFCDSSEQAYGSCVYLRSINSNKEVQVSLLCAKSKVAPLKTISIPRLELCAALLLSRLVDKVIRSMRIQLQSIYLWADSTISLSWIRTSPNLLKTFTGNRVSEIQSLTSSYHWRYISTNENPADIISRGMYPSQILNSKLWWNGPSWLTSAVPDFPDVNFEVKDLPELKGQSLAVQRSNDHLDFPFERFSSFSKMCRVAAYILRFKNNCLKTKSQRLYGAITVTELRVATKFLIKVCQYQGFSLEINSYLKNRKPIRSKLMHLTPFLDEDSILRVGGRLKHSDYNFDKKHPILLDSSHHFTKLLFQEEHNRLLHAAPQLLLSTVRNTYWPISGRKLSRATVRKCVRCFRFNAKPVQPIMGNLPDARIVPSSPFSITGVDYAGPFLIKNKAGRGSKVTKCYIGLFICFATKALHLELISSLSSSSFVQALRRFISRRGKPSKMFSDNGKNFVGAQREFGNFLASKDTFDSLSNFTSSELIDWEFIPPYSPHFGGLWEAGVKSSKHHLKRIMSKTPLTFEELCTICTQIEAILNSRPISPLSSDPNDLLPLTPAHFIIGRPITAAPDQDVTDIAINRLNRFQLVQQMCQHFWRRWKSEYISELQLRSKWKQNQGSLKKGLLVLIKEDSSSPTHWQLGRIIDVHPGTDGVSRVATIKTASGIIRRGFQMICPLPIDG